MTASLQALDAAVRQAGEDVHVHVKVVPGASRQRVMGMLGDRLKLAVKAPAHQGKANKAVCELLAEVLGVPPAAVSVIKGMTQPAKTVTVRQASLASVRSRLQAVLA